MQGIGWILVALVGGVIGYALGQSAERNCQASLEGKMYSRHPEGYGIVIAQYRGMWDWKPGGPFRLYLFKRGLEFVFPDWTSLAVPFEHVKWLDPRNGLYELSLSNAYTPTTGEEKFRCVDMDNRFPKCGEHRTGRFTLSNYGSLGNLIEIIQAINPRVGHRLAEDWEQWEQDQKT